jgi:hypothetical protein
MVTTGLLNSKLSVDNYTTWSNQVKKHIVVL